MEQKTKSILSSVRDDLVMASMQGETKFLGSLFGDITFKIRQLALNNPDSLPVIDLKDQSDLVVSSFFDLLEGYEKTLKLLKDEKEKD